MNSQRKLPHLIATSAAASTVDFKHAGDLCTHANDYADEFKFKLFIASRVYQPRAFLSTTAAARQAAVTPNY